jgi:hypothetical protein
MSKTNASNFHSANMQIVNRSSSLKNKLDQYKLAQRSMLNSTFLVDKKDFRNPIGEISRSTFGNPYLTDKFSRKSYAKEYALELKGKDGPSPDKYNGDLLKNKLISSFYKGDPEDSK